WSTAHLQSTTMHHLTQLNSTDCKESYSVYLYLSNIYLYLSLTVTTGVITL
ncbi:hypothetical protein L9F63_003177, partial [Diploptera punctata]